MGGPGGGGAAALVAHIVGVLEEEEQQRFEPAVAGGIMGDSGAKRACNCRFGVLYIEGMKVMEIGIGKRAARGTASSGARAG